MSLFNIFKKNKKEEPVEIKEIHSDLIENCQIGEYFYEGLINVPLFNRMIYVHIDFNVEIEYAEKCIEHFQNLNDKIIDELCCASIDYCMDYYDNLKEVRINIPETIKGKDILNYIEPLSLIINKLDNPDEIGYHLELNCPWEQEHGLEWTIKDNKVLYVGPFEDEPAISNQEYFDEINLNYANKQ